MFNCTLLENYVHSNILLVVNQAGLASPSSCHSLHVCQNISISKGVLIFVPKCLLLHYPKLLESEKNSCCTVNRDFTCVLIYECSSKSIIVKSMSIARSRPINS